MSPLPVDTAAAIRSYPTPEGATGKEQMNGGFFKMHPGAPVHVFTEARDEHFHCHPFDFTTHVARGAYIEEILLKQDDGSYHAEKFYRHEGTSHQMLAAVPHRLIGLPEGLCVTRCEYGPHIRKSGEYQLRPDGSVLFRHWDEPTWRPLPV